MKRIACLFVPDFPLAARVRSDPSLRDQPLAVVDGKGSHAMVIAVLPAVFKGGVRPGFSLPQTRALMPEVAFRQRDVEAERAAQDALIETGEAFSPRVEEAGPGVIYLDMCQENNESMLVELAVRRARLAGLSVRAGVGGGKLAARVAAEEATHGPIIIPSGREAEFLAPLPVARLHADEKTLEIIGRWGLKTAGAFAALSERDVMARLGREGWDLHRAAQGIDTRPLVPRAHTQVYSEGIELDWPIPSIAAFEEISHGLLERLMVRLAAVGLAARALSMTMKLDPVGADARSIPLPAPSRDIRSMLTLLLMELERVPPAEPVIGLTLTAAPERAGQAQLSLFDPPALSPDALNATLSRLAALVGPDRFGSPVAVDGHCPETFSMEAFNPPPPDARPATAGRALIAVRALRPRVEIEVQNGSIQKNKPSFVRSLRNDGTHAEIVGAIRVASGPWRMEDGWWLDRPVLRDYWDIELSDGALYRIFHDPILNRWWADGIYD